MRGAFITLIYTVLGIFLLTYGLLISRKIGGRTLPVWALMVVGAVLMVASLSISPEEALDSIDFRVISFLFGMLVICAGFENSGLIEYLVLILLRRAKNMNRLLLAIIFGSGLLSAVLVNDTIALLITPLVLSAASKIRLGENKVLLLPLAFGITTGSTLSPIGNPQNLLVALDSGMAAPFAEFLLYLAVPTLVALFAVYFICKFLYRKDLARVEYGQMQRSLDEPSSAISDWGLAKLSARVLLVLVFGFALVEIFPELQEAGLTLNVLALIAGIALLAITPRRLALLRSMNWGILIFFGGMFVVMRGVWDSGIGGALLSAVPPPLPNNSVQSTASIMISSTLLSQILSNVPFVQLYSYQLASLGFNSSHVVGWLALAAGSTLAGNLTLLGAVSNVIVIDSARMRGAESFSFLDFARAGVVITLVTGTIFFLFLAFV